MVTYSNCQQGPTRWTAMMVGICGLLYCVAESTGQDDKAVVPAPPDANNPLEPFLRAAEIAPGRPVADEQLRPRIAELIKQLGDDRFATREAADKSLREIGNLARVPLETAMQDKDAEIAARARSIVESLPELTHVVSDALESPVPLATVTLSLLPWTEKGKAVPQTVSLISDELGRVSVPAFPVAEYVMIARIQHVEYGTAQCKVDKPNGTLRYPLVRRGTEPYRRAVTGIVAGPDGVPIAGAMVQCRTVRTPGEGLINGIDPPGDAVTDADGSFVYYLANENRNRERGELIPANSRYDLTITVPYDESFFPVSGMYANRESVRIELPRATRFHRLRFEAVGGGLVDDPKLQRQFSIQYEGMQDGQKVLVPLGRDVAVNGRQLIPGSYRATGYINGKLINFPPLAVKADSPEELVFRLPPEFVYRGRVVHGVTGAPMPRAFLIGWSSTSRNNLALLSADDWKLLSDVHSNPDTDHPAVKKLRQFYGVEALVRTDEDGLFEITRRPDQEFYGLMAFDEDHVPFKKRTYYMRQGEHEDVFAAGDFLLFPAAKVLVRPVIEGQRVSVSPRWLPTDVQQPEWIERFHHASDRSKQEVEYVHWMELNELQPIYVPADVRLRLQFETPYNDEWSPCVIDTPLQLKHREVHRLGDVHFAAALSAVVRVVDKDGRPVEGIPVRRMHGPERAWSVAHNTDQDGRAFFHLNPMSNGQFRVLDIRGPDQVAQAKNLTADFQVGETAPARPYEIGITDEQIQLLLGSGR